jgi:hypothetical protein
MSAEPSPVWSLTPFINEMCLVLLVSIRHLPERELVRLGARVSGDGKPIPEEECWRLVAEEREGLPRREGLEKSGREAEPGLVCRMEWIARNVAAPR